MDGGDDCTLWIHLKPLKQAPKKWIREWILCCIFYQNKKFGKESDIRENTAIFSIDGFSFPCPQSGPLPYPQFLQWHHHASTYADEKPNIHPWIFSFFHLLYLILKKNILIKYPCLTGTPVISPHAVIFVKSSNGSVAGTGCSSIDELLYHKIKHEHFSNFLGNTFQNNLGQPHIWGWKQAILHEQCNCLK